MTGTLAPTIPTIGSPNSTEDPNIRDALVVLRDGINAVLTSGNILDGTKLSAASVALSALSHPTAGQVLIANASGVVTGRTASGDVTNDSSGVFTIADSAVTSRNLKPNMARVGDAALSQAITSGTPVDLTGITTTVTPVVASTMFALGCFDFSIEDTHSINQDLLGYMNVDGSRHAAVAKGGGVFANNTSAGNQGAFYGTVSRLWSFSLTAASHTVKLQAALDKTHGTETAKVIGAEFIYLLIHS